MACTLSRSQVRKQSSLWISAELERKHSREEKQLLLSELALRRDKSVLPLLCAQTQAGEEQLRHGAINALNHYDGTVEGRDDTYIELLGHPDDYMRRMALEGIIKRFQTVPNVPYLFNALKRIALQDSKWQSRQYAIKALTWTQGSTDILLDRAQFDDTDGVRIQAIMGLAIQTDEKSYSVLYRLAHKDSSKLVQQEATLALKKWGVHGHKVVLAVMPFDISPEHVSLEQGFRSYLSGRLGAAKIAKVVERGQVQQVVDELIYQDNFINDGKAVEIGKALRAEQVVTGSIQVVHGQVVITIKRIDVQSQEIVSSSESSGSFIDFDQIQREAATTFIKDF